MSVRPYASMVYRKETPRYGRSVLLWLGFVAALLGAGGYALRFEIPHTLIGLAWHRAQQSDSAVRPWPGFNSTPVARIVIPGHDAGMIILSGADGRVLNYGPGWHEGTDMPGQPGISVILGHRDRHFKFLDRLQEGDTLALRRRDGVDLTYLVESIRFVDTPEIQVPVQGRESILLLTASYVTGDRRPGQKLNLVVMARSLGEQAES